MESQSSRNTTWLIFSFREVQTFKCGTTHWDHFWECLIEWLLVFEFLHNPKLWNENESRTFSRNRIKPLKSFVDSIFQFFSFLLFVTKNYNISDFLHFLNQREKLFLHLMNPDFRSTTSELCYNYISRRRSYTRKFIALYVNEKVIFKLVDERSPRFVVFPNSLFFRFDSKNVDFAGYSIPHPSENKMNLRIQTTSKGRIWQIFFGFFSKDNCELFSPFVKINLLLKRWRIPFETSTVCVLMSSLHFVKKFVNSKNKILSVLSPNK
jgi:hypothetical protein